MKEIPEVLQPLNTLARRLLNRARAVKYNSDRFLTESLHQNALALHWFRGFKNFGDQMAPLILRQYGFFPFYSPVEKSLMISTGSILDNVPENYSGHIVGSGLLFDSRIQLRNATIWAVRGELTRDRIGADKNVVLGDPGLLARKLLRKRQTKSYILGIVPHYHERHDIRIHQLSARHSSDILVIDVTNDPLTVLRNIDKCEHVISSSLHGMVVADSLGIPNAWMLLSDKVEGRGFKFRDYGSAVGRIPTPHPIAGKENLLTLCNRCAQPPQKLEAVLHELDSLLNTLRDHL